ncbi:MAG: rhomboid family intramembrane serine protease [Lachnospiraceae bacterium]|nr:rhomboid family intramembrane serine protease [Lachnospiraceae bacterium]
MWNYGDNDVGEGANKRKEEVYDDLSDLEVVEIKSTDIPKTKTPGSSQSTYYYDDGFWNGRATYWKECYLTLIVVGLNVLVFVMQVLNRKMDAYGNVMDPMIEGGCMSWPTVFGDGQIYRLITAQFLHAGIGHLFGNMVFLFMCGSMLEKRLSRKRWLILYGAGGLGASLSSVIIGHYFPTIMARYVVIGGVTYEIGRKEVYDVASVGASGAIAALIAAIVLYKLLLSSPLDGYSDNSWAPVLELAFAYLIYSAVSGMFETTAGVDNKAHIGGLITGIVVMLVYMLIEYKKQSQPTWD